MSALRIAITGSAGTGKTTLASTLAAELGLPVIGEGMRDYLERTGIDPHSLGHEGMKNLVRQLWVERQAQEAAATGGFVADRAGIDHAAFWLYYHYAREDAETQQLFAEALAPERYTHLFVLPWGRLPLLSDGIRTADAYVQRHVQLLIEGLLRQQGLPHQMLQSLTLPARVAEILEAIRQ